MNGLIIGFVGLIAFSVLIVCGEGLYWEIRLNIRIRQLKKIEKELEDSWINSAK